MKQGSAVSRVAPWVVYDCCYALHSLEVPSEMQACTCGILPKLRLNVRHASVLRLMQVSGKYNLRSSQSGRGLIKVDYDSKLIIISRVLFTFDCFAYPGVMVSCVLLAELKGTCCKTL